MMIRAFPRCSRCERPVNRNDSVRVRDHWWHPPCWEEHELETLAEAIRAFAL